MLCSAGVIVSLSYHDDQVAMDAGVRLRWPATELLLLKPDHRVRQLHPVETMLLRRGLGVHKRRAYPTRVSQAREDDLMRAAVAPILALRRPVL